MQNEQLEPLQHTTSVLQKVLYHAFMWCLLLGSFPIGVQRRFAASCNSSFVVTQCLHATCIKMADDRGLRQMMSMLEHAALEFPAKLCASWQAAITGRLLDKADLDACAPVLQVSRPARITIEARGTVFASSCTTK